MHRARRLCVAAARRCYKFFLRYQLRVMRLCAGGIHSDDSHQQKTPPRVFRAALFVFFILYRCQW